MEQLQWRLQNGEAPSGVGARLAVLHIGTNDLGFQAAEVTHPLPRYFGLPRVLYPCSLAIIYSAAAKSFSNASLQVNQKPEGNKLRLCDKSHAPLGQADDQRAPCPWP